MDATEFSFGIIILIQLSLGLPVNVFLLSFYVHVVSTSHKPSSSDLILAHLALANTIILLTIGIPEVMSAWGLRNFLDDVGCKVLMYLYRVGRGLAICTTCLLSVFQAVTLTPGGSRWAGVKAKLPKWILPSFLLSWILNMLVDSDTAIYMISPQNNGSFQIMLDLKYCSDISDSEETTLVITVVLSMRDLFFVGLMSAASSYMVFVLHRHHRRVRHLQQPGRSPRATPEVRAAKRVVALVTLYVLLYGRQTIMLSVLVNVKEKSPLLVKSHMVFLLTFSAVSPFLMIHSDRRMRIFVKRQSPGSDRERF
ncbi:vomeronasal 1 receptor ornAnaV1R3187 [Ornithorhynchus anatinus]|uniref:Vomeronasal type-1 receptor n=1 Tax=Ornithorhynchus anatinus TaxID=9258 RepID=A0A6I8NFN2_ORNAN|nr:vomeronasal 1 receptor ornAnaV1R3187 [Ornithorhynchus anatinus]